MKVLCLDTAAWREFRGTPSCPGINLTTHLAKISDPVGKLHDCYVKLLPINTPALLGEAIGWSLAKSADVSCSPFAAIVMVPLDKLRQSIKLPENFDGLDVCPAWCCELVPGKPMRQIHNWLYFLALKRCLHSKDVRKIAAFDCWSDLRDRNMGNVIRSTNGGYIAIDHESILHDILWAPTGRGFEERSLLAVANDALSEKDLKRFHLDMAHASDGHLDALLAVGKEVERLIAVIYPRIAATLIPLVIEALTERAGRGWLAAKIGVIA